MCGCALWAILPCSTVGFIMPQRLATILFCLLMPGCIIIDTGVTNPLPQMSRVAVVPFRNLTSLPNEAVDGRRFAMTYASELQKVPGFEVLPVGVVEVAMVESGLKFDRPDDLLQLARLLDVDLIAVGAITDYNPYYPPRIGLQVEWLSPKPALFSPGVQTDPEAREHLIEAVDEERKQLKALRKAEKKSQSKWSRIRKHVRIPVTFRGQSPDATNDTVVGDMKDDWQSADDIEQTLQNAPMQVRTDGSVKPAQLQSLSPSLFEPSGTDEGSIRASRPSENASALDTRAEEAETGPATPLLPPVPPPAGPSRRAIPHPADFPSSWSDAPTPPRPVMAYSRFFDGADADLVAELRDYVELNGDLRGGGWEAYLQRSDDFIRFVCHRMIEEMLTLHGGEGKRRIVLKLRKYR